jgi:hypothetical protein
MYLNRKKRFVVDRFILNRKASSEILLFSLRNTNIWGGPFTTEDEDIDENSEPQKLLYNNASWFSCYINLASTIIGAGILGVPYAFSKAGWILGTFLLVLCAFLSVFGLHLLSICAKKVSRLTNSMYIQRLLCSSRSKFHLPFTLLHLFQFQSSASALILQYA